MGFLGVVDELDGFRKEDEMGDPLGSDVGGMCLGRLYLHLNHDLLHIKKAARNNRAAS